MRRIIRLTAMVAGVLCALTLSAVADVTADKESSGKENNTDFAPESTVLTQKSAKLPTPIKDPPTNWNGLEKNLEKEVSAPCYVQSYAGAPSLFWKAPDPSWGDNAYAMRFSVCGADTLQSVDIFIYDPGDGSFGNDDVYITIHSDDGFGLPGPSLASVTLPGGSYPAFPTVTTVDFISYNLVLASDFHVAFSSSAVFGSDDYESILSDDGTMGVGRSSSQNSGVWTSMLVGWGIDVNFLIDVQLCPEGPDVGADVDAGSNLLETAQDGTFDFGFLSDSGGTPLPADFFGPGSDPWDAPLQYSGVSLDATENLLRTSTVIERLDDAVLPCIGSSDTVPIIIRALRLRDTITVTYNGGASSEEWEVNVCLSQGNQQDTGIMIISLECPEGGTFTSQLLVDPRLTFTLLSNPATVIVIDPGPEVILFIPEDTAYWMYDDSLADFSVLTANGGNVDHDCDGVVDEPYAATSNFVASMQAIPCGGAKSPQAPYSRRLTYTIYTNADLHKTHIIRSALAFVCGDSNNSGGVDVADLTFLVDYLFRGGPPPPVPEAADVDGSGGLDVADLTYLVDYLFRNGQEPVCS